MEEAKLRTERERVITALEQKFLEKELLRTEEVIKNETEMTATEKMRYVEDIERDAQKTIECLEKWGFSNEQILEYMRIMRNSEAPTALEDIVKNESILETVDLKRNVPCSPDNSNNGTRYRSSSKKAKVRRHTSDRKAKMRREGVSTRHTGSHKSSEALYENIPAAGRSTATSKKCKESEANGDNYESITSCGFVTVGKCSEQAATSNAPGHSSKSVYSY